MARKRKGRCVKRNKQAVEVEPEHLTRAPHSFVFHRGPVGKYVFNLMKDFRKIMEPFTASSLRPRKKNSIKDFVAISGLLHVSHMVVFTLTPLAPYMKIGRLPRGPTLTFKIHNYVLARDVLSSLKRQLGHPKLFENSPLVVLNGFSVGSTTSGDGEETEEAKINKLLVSTFQGMFPTINVAKVNLNDIRRCLLFNYDSDTKLIEMRHYGISVKPIGISKGVKKLIGKKIPNLAKFDDVASYLKKADVLSDSEAEDDPQSHVTLPQTMGFKGNAPGNKSAIRLTELGPRLTLQLIKIEAELMDGEVLYHEFVHKTEEEKEAIRKRREDKRKLKMKRKLEQMKNVKKKEDLKEEMKRKSIEGMKKHNKGTENEILMKKAAEEGASQVEDDDAQWFREEVGEDPEPELFEATDRSGGEKRKRDQSNFKPYKKLKTGRGGGGAGGAKRRHPSSGGGGQGAEDRHQPLKRGRGPFGMKARMKKGQPMKGMGRRKSGGGADESRRGGKRKNLGTRVSQGKRH